MTVDELNRDKVESLDEIESEKRSLAIADRLHSWGFVKTAEWTRALARECIAYYEARIAWDDAMISAIETGGDVQALMTRQPIYPAPTPPPRERL